MISLSAISKSFTEKSQRRSSEYLLNSLLSMLRFKPSGAQKINVLKAIDLEVPAGSRLAVLGRNRSGKTTLMHLIAGIIVPTSGKMMIRGKVIPFFGLGVGFSTILTGRENLILNATSLGASMHWVHTNMAAIQEFSEIADLDVPLKFFSNGMKTRLALAIAVFIPADILILDEVFDGVDVFFREKALDRIIKNTEANQTTLLVVSHDQEILKRLCTSAICLREGKLVAQGDLSLIDDYQNEPRIIYPAPIDPAQIY